MPLKQFRPLLSLETESRNQHEQQRHHQQGQQTSYRRQRGQTDDGTLDPDEGLAEAGRRLGSEIDDDDDRRWDTREIDDNVIPATSPSALLPLDRSLYSEAGSSATGATLGGSTSASSSSVIGPTSPSVKSVRSLGSPVYERDRHMPFSSPHHQHQQMQHQQSQNQYNINQDQYQSQSQPSGSAYRSNRYQPHRRAESLDIASSGSPPPSTMMDLSKLGGVGGVSRSGSFNSQRFASIGRGGKSARSRLESMPSAGEEDTFAASIREPVPYSISDPSRQAVGSVGHRGGALSSSSHGHTLLDDDDREAASGSSRGSTNESHYSHSAAVSSLRSLSDRSANRSSASSSNTALSVSPPGGTFSLSSSTRKPSSRGSVDADHENTRLASSPPLRSRDPSSSSSSQDLSHKRPSTDSSNRLSSPEQRSSFVGPGVSRVRSIGRGSFGNELEEAARKPSAIQPIDETADSSMPGPDSSAIATTPPLLSSVASQESQATLVPDEITTIADIDDSHNRKSKKASSSAAPGSALAEGTSRDPMETRTPLPASRAPATRPGQTFPAPANLNLTSTSSSGSFCKGFSFIGSAPTSPLGEQLLESSGSQSAYPWTESKKEPDVQSPPPPPRRHTGTRTRSALAQMVSGLSSGVGGTMPFGGSGTEGGRRAAREKERARLASLARLGPLSNASIDGKLSSARSSPIQAEAAAQGNSGRPLTPSDYGSDSTFDTRPLSPPARSPTMGQSATLGLQSKAFSSMASLLSNSTSGDHIPHSASLSDLHEHVEAAPSPETISSARNVADARSEQQPQAQQTLSPDRPSVSRQHSRFSLAIGDAQRWSHFSRSEQGDAGSATSALPSPKMDSSGSVSSSLPQSESSLVAMNLDSSIAPAPVMTPSASATNVLRTPTTEEWARYLASQGVEPGHIAAAVARSRTSTGRAQNAPFGGMGSVSSRRSTGRLSGLPTGGSRGERELNQSLQSLMSMTSLSSTRDEVEPGRVSRRSQQGSIDEAGRESIAARWEVRSSHSRSSSPMSVSDSDSESDSSEDGRMEALHAAISMPPSRRGSPKLGFQMLQPPEEPQGGASVGAATAVASALPRSPSVPGDASPSTRAAAANALVTPRDPLWTSQIQLSHGYTPAPTGRKRNIDDFYPIQDVGRGAYGLVKLVRLKSSDGQFLVGPEFVVKYIIKSRILADCWRRHRHLGPIPVEIHVMDQLRRLPYRPPSSLPPWAPEKLWDHPAGGYSLSDQEGSRNLDEEDLCTPPAGRTPAGKTIDLAENGETFSSLGEDSFDQDDTLRVDTSASRLSLSAPSPSGSLNAAMHPSLATMLDFFEDESFYYLVMPRFGLGTDLFDYIESRPYGLQTREARCILGQVVDGIAFLHENGIVHRDIKDENVILDGEGHAQLIDFGSAAHVKSGRLFDTFSGTLDYAAAEILRGDQYSGKEQDVWAIGIVAYVCLVGDAPFWNGEEAMSGLSPDSRALATLTQRASEDPTLSHSASVSSQDDSSSPPPPETAEAIEAQRLQRQQDIAGQADGGGTIHDGIDFIKLCLALDPSKRPTAQQLKLHPFLIGRSNNGSDTLQQP